MYWDAKFVKPLPDYRIYMELEGGRTGIFDLKPYLDRGAWRELRDIHYFNQVGILFGAVTWPHEQDIAPEPLLAEMAPAELVAVPAGRRDDPRRRIHPAPTFVVRASARHGGGWVMMKGDCSNVDEYCHPGSSH